MSQNHRITRAGRYLWRWSSPTLLHYSRLPTTELRLFTASQSIVEVSLSLQDLGGCTYYTKARWIISQTKLLWLPSHVVPPCGDSNRLHSLVPGEPHQQCLCQLGRKLLVSQWKPRRARNSLTKWLSAWITGWWMWLLACILHPLVPAHAWSQGYLSSWLLCWVQ